MQIVCPQIKESLVTHCDFAVDSILIEKGKKDCCGLLKIAILSGLYCTLHCVPPISIECLRMWNCWGKPIRIDQHLLCFCWHQILKKNTQLRNEIYNMICVSQHQSTGTRRTYVAVSFSDGTTARAVLSPKILRASSSLVVFAVLCSSSSFVSRCIGRWTVDPIKKMKPFVC